MNVTINTDASFCPHTKAAGFAVWIVCNKGRLKYSGSLRNAENSTTAEAQAIANALFLLEKSHINDGSITRIYLNSDCISALECIRKKSPYVAGRFVYRTAKRILKNTGGMGNFIKRHVKAHTGKQDKRSWVNDWCDTEAKKWMNKERIKIKSSYAGHFPPE